MKLDPMRYLPTPRLSANRGISLVQELFAAAPPDPEALLQRWVDDMKRYGETLKVSVVKRDKVEPSKARPADLELDAALGALHSRIEATARLSPDHCPDAARARELLTLLFPKGLGWLNSSFDEEWALSEALLKQVADANLAEELDRLAGPGFLAELRRAHTAYGEVLGKARPLEDDSVNLWEEIRNLADAITGYTVQMLGTVDESRPETVEQARRALQPILDFKQEAARRSSAPAKASSPTATPA